MDKKIGRTLNEACDEYLKTNPDLTNFHRDIDEVLSDPSIHDAFDAVMKADPKGERAFWESAYERAKEDNPNSQWVENLEIALETNTFPPKPCY